ncbi:MAG: protein kinase, partial [Gemmatimonadaceae bacterium]|nr:protein kinase [Gemmatimonadaceae bacterium]
MQEIFGPGCTIERELGGGGMSRVFLARDVALDRAIVVKVLPPDLAHAVSVDRFKREIQLAARLQHPHIVPVLTAASAGDILYYTMPFVDGESVGARISRVGALPVADSISILRDAARALAYAHRRGVVHRDIKPDNILLSEDSALVADFGIAKAVTAAAGSGQGLTTVGVSVGTPAYMAPEQSVGDITVDHRADIYALGAVAYEMLTGHHPFAGRTPQQMMAAHVMETPQPLATRAPSIPAGLAKAVMQCLEKDPPKRPQSAEALLLLLEAATTPVSGTTSTPLTRRRRWKLAAGMALLTILLIAGGAVAFAPRDRIAMAVALMRREPATLHPNRIIVTPFENETGDPKMASLGAMAADWLAQGLTRVGGIEVVDARTTLVTGEVVDKIPWPFKSRDRRRALAEETGAGIVLSGRIYRDGDSLRIQAKMSDAESGKLLRALTTVSGPVAEPTKVLDMLNRRVGANV